jgi:hypothetical protein
MSLWSISLLESSFIIIFIRTAHPTGRKFSHPEEQNLLFLADEVLWRATHFPAEPEQVAILVTTRPRQKNISDRWTVRIDSLACSSSALICLVTL